MPTYLVIESPHYYPGPGSRDFRYAGTSLRASEAEFDVLVAKRIREAQRGFVESAEIVLVEIDSEAHKWRTIREAAVGSDLTS